MREATTTKKEQAMKYTAPEGTLDFTTPLRKGHLVTVADGATYEVARVRKGDIHLYNEDGTTHGPYNRSELVLATLRNANRAIRPATK